VVDFASPGTIDLSPMRQLASPPALQFCCLRGDPFFPNRPKGFWESTPWLDPAWTRSRTDQALPLLYGSQVIAEGV